MPSGSAFKLWAAGSIRTFAPPTFASPWAASPPSSPSTIWTARSGTPPRWGPKSASLAERLLDRLRKRFAPGGLLHYGQGKWYPGEPLPRWALTCYWRADGVPLWHDRSLLAQEEFATDFGPLEARHFAETLARRLGLDPEYVNPAFEDPVYYLQKERQLPVNVDPSDNRLGDASERERLRKVFERGLDTPTGFVLPVQRVAGLSGPEWQTGLWMLRGQHLFLMPGDSPVGLRLPLPSLPWVAPSEAPVELSRGSHGESRAAAHSAAICSRGRSAPAIAKAIQNAIANPQSANRRPGSCARPCAWRRATGACMCSCRR